MNATCRTCLKEIRGYYFLALGENEQSLQFKRQLAFCIPEIVIDKVINPVVCIKCVQTINAAYEFKTTCLQSETRIDSYLKNQNCDKFEISKLKSYSPEINKSVDLTVESPTRDVIDDLNDLLDEALNETSQQEDDVFVESEPESGPDDVQEPPVQNAGTVNESIVKLPNNMDSSENDQPLRKRKPKKKSFMCKLCNNYSTGYHHNLVRHMTTHSDEKPVACQICPYRCKYEAVLRKHMIVHHGLMNRTYIKKNDTKKAVIKQYSCDVCGCKGLSKAKLRKHYIKFHSDEDPISTVGEYFKNHVTEYKINQNDRSNKQVACHQCKYKASSKKLLEAHVKEKHNSNPDVAMKFSCHKCSYQGTSSTCLKRHMDRHFEHETYHYCNQCEFKALSKSVITVHMKESHSNSIENETVSDNLFPCDLCSYKGNSENHLKRHFLRVHVTSNEVFPCNLCTYKGSTKDLLKRHSKIHCKSDGTRKSVVSATSKKRYACKLCPYSSAFSWNFTNHVRLSHKDI